MSSLRFLNAAEARLRYDADLVTRLEAAIDETDTVGDEISAVCREMPGGAGPRAIDAWLDRRGQAPAELAELLGGIEVVPDWVDWDRIERASVAYWRGGLWTGLALNCASLAAGYRSGAGVKPLVFTGRLVRMAYRRQQETARWLTAATAPGGLRRDGAGFKETVRVRIVHSHVRARLLAGDRWRAEEWGAPINICDTAYGIAGEFSTVPVAAMSDVGIHYTQQERDDIQHMWRYVGHLLGVPEGLLPEDEARALEICHIKDFTDTPPDEDSRALLTALIENGTPPELLMPHVVANVMGRFVAPTLYGFTRRWAGDAVADELGIPDTPLKHLGAVLRPAVQAGELVRRVGLVSDSMLANATRTRAVGVLDKGKAPAGIVSMAETQKFKVSA